MARFTVSARNLQAGDVIISAPNVVGVVATSGPDFDNLGAQIVMLASGERFFVGSYDAVQIERA